MYSTSIYHAPQGRVGICRYWTKEAASIFNARLRTERVTGGQHRGCAGGRRGFHSQESILRFSP